MLKAYPPYGYHSAQTFTRRLAMPYCPCFYCNNMGCPLYGKSEHELPFPTLPQIKPHPKTWPTDAWKALLLCPVCKQFHIYTKADILWRARTEEETEVYLEDTVWFCAKFECAGLGCGTPAELHVVTCAGTQAEEVDNMLRSGAVDGTLPCDHPFLLPKSIQISQEPNRQTIRSYLH